MTTVPSALAEDPAQVGGDAFPVERGAHALQNRAPAPHWASRATQRSSTGHWLAQSAVAMS